MGPYLGLRGQKLVIARIVMVVLPSFLLFGYNQSQIGGVLGFKSFTTLFPLMDTAHTKGAVKAHHSTIQGEIFQDAGLSNTSPMLMSQFRNCGGDLYYRLPFRRPPMYSHW